MCYVDKVVITTHTFAAFIDKQDEVFDCLKKGKLKVQTIKVRNSKGLDKYLDRMVDKKGGRPDSDAVEAVITWKALILNKQLMSF